jgi:hypothetical protein
MDDGQGPFKIFYLGIYERQMIHDLEIKVL